MYTLVFDFGSTNFKYLVLKIAETEKETNIEIIGKGRSIATDFALFIYEIIKKYNIDIKNIEKILATGTGSSYLEDRFEEIEIVKIDEFNAIAYGGLILSKLDKGNIVSIGTGTTIVYSDLEKVERIGGTGLGGGTLVGLGSAILSNLESDNKEITNFKTLIDMAKKGDKSHVDLMIGDISKNNIGNMTSNITAANFAALQKKANKNDYIAAALNMILENIMLIIKSINNKQPSVFIGTMVVDDYVKNCIKKIAEYTKNEVIFVDDAEYAIVIGAWEYYLLKIRKNY
jgi:type II pantothenate kinase